MSPIQELSTSHDDDNEMDERRMAFKAEAGQHNINLDLSVSFTGHIDDPDTLAAVFGIELDSDGHMKPPAPYETWDAYHAEVYRFCDQLRAIPGVADVTYDEPTGELCILFTDNTVWKGGIPEFNRQYEALRKAKED